MVLSRSLGDQSPVVCGDGSNAVIWDPAKKERYKLAAPVEVRTVVEKDLGK